MAELAARGVVVERREAAHGSVRALDGVDLELQQGELVAVMGATGAGKSTLALVLAGAETPTSGSITGSAAGDARLVLQRPEASFLEARVLDEVSIAARWRGEPRARAERRAHDALVELALPADVAGRDPLALSGGEQRRVAIAAVLASDPRVMILDEPSAGLDAAARSELHAAIERLGAAGRTIVLVTHDPAEAARLATRLIVLDAGRVAWDGPVGAVLGDPERATQLGIDVAPEVRMLHAVAAARGVRATRQVARPDDAVRELAQLLATPPTAATTTPAAASPPPPAPPHPARGARPASRALPPLVDARVRLLACALAIAAALLAETILAAAIVVLATAIVVALARISRSRVRLAVRPLIALAVLLVLLQVLVGGESSTELAPGRSSDLPALAALLRALQASAVVLATLALSAATAATDLAAAFRSVLAPLRLLRVPVGALAFVLATGLGLVPTLADELDRLRIAQRARGMRPTGGGMLARLRADALLLTPLFVAAFRRSHLLADALAVRGFDPAARVRPWRPRTIPASDLLLLAGGVALVVLSRLA